MPMSGDYIRTGGAFGRDLGLSLLATSKIGTLRDPRDQGSDEGLVSSLRALLWCFRRAIV